MKDFKDRLEVEEEVDEVTKTNVETDSITADKIKTDSEEELFTKAEVDRQITLSVENALKKRQKKFDEELERVARETAENAIREAKMTEEERAKANFDKREAELQRREMEQARREMLVEIKSELGDRDLPLTFADYLVTDNIDESMNAIAEIKQEWDSQIAEAIKAKARQKEPRATSEASAPVTLSYAELAKKHRKVD